MDHYVRGAYDQAIEAFGVQLQSLLSSTAAAPTPRLMNHRASTVMTNIAACELALDLSRRCIKSCERAIELSPMNLRGHILIGKANLSLKKQSKALEVWKAALAMAMQRPSSEHNPASSDVPDLGWVQELQDLIAAEGGSLDNSHTNNGTSNSSCAAVRAGNATTGVADSGSTISSLSTVSIAADNEAIEHTPTISSAIAELHCRYIGEGAMAVPAPLIAMVRANLPCRSGSGRVDDLVACGYLLVNQRDLTAAIALFDKLLSYHSVLPAALLGKGSAQATLGRFSDAVDSFTAAIDLSPGLSDAWKRRGQTRAAMADLSAALDDLNEALRLDGGAQDSYRQRGEVYLQAKDYLSALVDFKHARARGGSSAELLNFIGMCEGQLGNIEASVAAHDAAIEANANFKEAILNRAWMLKEAALWEDAERGLLQAIRVGDSLLAEASESASGGATDRFFPAYSYMALLQHGLGRPQRALTNALVALPGQLAKNDVSGLELTAACHTSLGHYRAAVAIYSSILSSDPQHSCGWQRDVALYVWSRLDNGLDSFNRDAEVAPSTKEGWINKRPYSPSSRGLVEPSCRSFEDPNPNLPAPAAMKVAAVERLEAAARPLQRIVQLRCLGFLPNCRQHYMFGMAVLQMAQSLSRHVTLLASGEPGLLVARGRASSAAARASEQSSSSSARHIFCWRDFIDIAVLWRQVSEPNDPVWWIDLMSRSSFEAGFGLQTPIVNGQLKTCRYYCYYPKAASRLVGELISAGGYCDVAGHFTPLSAGGRSSLCAMQGRECAVELEEVYAAVGQDFYVVIPCAGSGCWEGTRLTLLRHEPNGFEFTIRTPGTPSRWAQFSGELSTVFSRIADRLADPCGYTDSTLLLADGLELFYYFVTFAPLSRGSAVCGYAALCAVLRCGGYELAAHLPENRQLDWEAILAQTRSAFCTTAASLVQVRLCEGGLDELPSVAQAFPTLRAVVEGLLRAK